VAALSAEEIENTYTCGQKSADDKKPKKNVIAVHCGLKIQIGPETAAICGYKTADRRSSNQRKGI
jgi:hypothetical protein